MKLIRGQAFGNRTPKWRNQGFSSMVLEPLLSAITLGRTCRHGVGFNKCRHGVGFNKHRPCGQTLAQVGFADPMEHEARI